MEDTCGVGTLNKGNKAEMLNDQFSSVFTHEDTASIPELGPSPFKEMPSIKVSEAGVLKLSKDLKKRKASGHSYPSLQKGQKIGSRKLPPSVADFHLL